MAGASGGIGTATVEALLRKDYRVWAVARDEMGWQRLSERFGEPVRALAFDVTDSHAIFEAAEEVIAAGPLFGLVKLTFHNSRCAQPCAARPSANASARPLVAPTDFTT